MPAVWPKLFHAVALIDAQPKAVSSSEAHQRVVAAPSYPQRVAVAKQRCQALQTLGLDQAGWGLGYQIVRDEYQDMHQLFHEVGFEFITPPAKQLLGPN